MEASRVLADPAAPPLRNHGTQLVLRIPQGDSLDCWLLHPTFPIRYEATWDARSIYDFRPDVEAELAEGYDHLRSFSVKIDEPRRPNGKSMLWHTEFWLCWPGHRRVVKLVDYLPTWKPWDRAVGGLDHWPHQPLKMPLRDATLRIVGPKARLPTEVVIDIRLGPH